MAKINYARTYSHVDWVDNEDVVTADGSHGFNPEFHSIEGEFDTISAAFAATNTAISQLQQLTFLNAVAPQTLQPNTVSAEFPVETYDATSLPANVEKVYFPIILVQPAAGNFSVLPTFLYRQLLNNKIQVTVTFYNPTTTAVQFAFRILSFAIQTTS